MPFTIATICFAACYALALAFDSLGGSLALSLNSEWYGFQATVLPEHLREAGRLLGVPAGTVRTRMARARTQLQEALT